MSFVISRSQDSQPAITRKQKEHFKLSPSTALSHKIHDRRWSQPRNQPIYIWCGSGWSDRSRSFSLTLSDFYIYFFFRSFLSEWYVHIQVAVICELIQFDADPNSNLDWADSDMLDVGSDLIELKETVGPWRRYALYWALWWIICNPDESAFCFPEITRQTSLAQRFPCCSFI